MGATGSSNEDLFEDAKQNQSYDVSLMKPPNFIVERNRERFCDPH